MTTSGMFDMAELARWFNSWGSSTLEQAASIWQFDPTTSDNATEQQRQASVAAFGLFQQFTRAQQSIHIQTLQAAARIAMDSSDESPEKLADRQMEILLSAMNKSAELLAEFAEQVAGSIGKESFVSESPGNHSDPIAALLKQYQDIPQIFASVIGGLDESSTDYPDWQAARANYITLLLELLVGEPENIQLTHKRFDHPSWRTPPFIWTAALYELNSQFLLQCLERLPANTKPVQQLRFTVEQMLDALSPANFLATNPQAQDAFVRTGGNSYRDGLKNLARDIQKGGISMSDDSAFTVGENLAVTPGMVVFENQLVQLIQYTPSTPTVSSIPLLIVPPCINKFYVLDLQPQNSFVRWLVAQGHTVFLISWRNVDAAQGHLSWDDYLNDGVVRAISLVQSISGSENINALGFCVGGTMLSTALAALAARHEYPVQSLTLLTTLLDFENPGALGVMIDETQVSLREAALSAGGILPAADLAITFSSLRPNELLWNYVSANYLQGETQRAHDLLFWNADGTNLPGPAFVWYLRHLYLQNELSTPGKLNCLGQSIDLSELQMPAFIYGSHDDHIVPWSAAYESRNLLSGPIEFVLGSSGHVAGVVNPPDSGKRHHWIGSCDSPDPQIWLDNAEKVVGSWWPHLAQWLKPFRGELIDAKCAPRGDGNKPIESAPGRYVLKRA